MPASIFFCYAREDEALLKKLKSHLRPLQRQGRIDIWYDREISAGAEWEPEIKKHLDAARILLLLVSPDFIDSDYCYGIEMKRALERHGKGEATVILIIFRPAYWHGETLGKLQVRPTDGKPVTMWPDRDAAFYDVTEGIYKVVVQLSTPAVSASPAIGDVKPQQKAPVPSIPLPPQQERHIAPTRVPFAVEKLALLRTSLVIQTQFSV